MRAALELLGRGKLSALSVPLQHPLEGGLAMASGDGGTHRVAHHAEGTGSERPVRGQFDWGADHHSFF